MTDSHCKTDNLFNNSLLTKKIKVSKDTPGRMSDGRYLSDHRNSTLVNEVIKMDNKIVKNNLYREYLIKNTDKLKSKNLKDEECKFKINTCVFDHNSTRVDSSSFSSELKRYNDSMKKDILGNFKDNCQDLEDYLL